MDAQKQLVVEISTLPVVFAPNLKVSKVMHSIEPVIYEEGFAKRTAGNVVP